MILARGWLTPNRPDRPGAHVSPYALLDRLAPRFGLRRLLVMERCVGSAAPAPVRLPAGVRVGEADARALEAMAALGAAAVASRAATSARLARYREQLARGDRPFVAERDGQLLALCWAAAGAASVPYLACELRLRGDERYLYDALTRVDARGQRLLPALYTHALAELARHGARRAITLVRPVNRPMLRAMQHAGFTPCGALARLSLAGRTLYLGAPGVAYRQTPAT
jgi:GNAT superfamily N-acetyltransferase